MELGFVSPSASATWLSGDELHVRVADATNSGDLTQIFAAANRVALQLHRAGQTIWAQRLLRSQVEFSNCNQKIIPPAVALQPAINLMRIACIAGDPGAVKALDDLEHIADGHPIKFQGLDPHCLVQDTTESASAARILARLNVILEIPRIHRRLANLETLMAESQRLIAKWPKTIDSGVYHPIEGLLIADPSIRLNSPPANFSVIAQIHMANRRDQPDAWRRKNIEEIREDRVDETFSSHLSSKSRFYIALSDICGELGMLHDSQSHLSKARQAAEHSNPILAAKLANIELSAGGELGVSVMKMSAREATLEQLKRMSASIENILDQARQNYLINSRVKTS